jgi:hypothetical protein
VSPPAAEAGAGWRRFITAFLASAGIAGLAILAFVTLFDPYGGNPFRLPLGQPLMDTSQRHVYPQIARSGRFDAAVIGSSTLRLVEPATLSAATGARFANLAINAATPWEQIQVADLFARETVHPRALVWGLDPTWCEPDADTPAKRTSPHGFPAWAWDANRWNDIPNLFSMQTFEIAGRLVAAKLGLAEPRIRDDGYQVFTPPEAAFDLARARSHIYGEETRAREAMDRIAPPVPEPDWPLPALDWLEAALARFPADTRIVLVVPPEHVAWQPRAGSFRAARDAACRTRIAGIARERGARALDFRIDSAVTREDANFWDPLHHRLPVAARFTDEIARALTKRPPADAGDGQWLRVLAP